MDNNDIYEDFTQPIGVKTIDEKRAAPLSSIERFRLIELVQERKEIILNRCQEAGVNAKKNKAWSQIEKQMNLNSQIRRTTKQLQRAWNKIAGKMRKEADEKEIAHGSDDGEFGDDLTDESRAVVNIYGPNNPTLTGLGGFKSGVNPTSFLATIRPPPSALIDLDCERKLQVAFTDDQSPAASASHPPRSSSTSARLHRRSEISIVSSETSPLVPASSMRAKNNIAPVLSSGHKMTSRDILASDRAISDDDYSIRKSSCKRARCERENVSKPSEKETLAIELMKEQIVKLRKESEYLEAVKRAAEAFGRYYDKLIMEQ